MSSEMLRSILFCLFKCCYGGTLATLESWTLNLASHWSRYRSRGHLNFACMTKKVPLCNSSAVQLRFLCPNDIDEVKRLCSEWFPVEYPDNWYREITSSSRFYSLASVYNHRIIGLIVAEIKPPAKSNDEDLGILSPHFPLNTQVAYILSLGVVQDYRRNGIASLLLDNLISHLTSVENGPCKALYLHVLTSNITAIRFYEQKHFQQHSYLPYYYSIHGKPRDGYLYVLYLNGGHPPWTIVLSTLEDTCRALIHVLFQQDYAVASFGL